MSNDATEALRTAILRESDPTDPDLYTRGIHILDEEEDDGHECSADLTCSCGYPLAHNAHDWTGTDAVLHCKGV